MSDAQRGYRLIPYVNQNGKMPAQAFLEELAESDTDAFAKFQDLVRPLVEEFGPRTPMPHFKHLPPTDFSEIRWNGKGHAHYRIYCTIEDEGRILLLHAVAKRWPKFDRDDKRVCRTRYTDYNDPKYDAGARLASRHRS
jgi:phage-related protein